MTDTGPPSTADAATRQDVWQIAEALEAQRLHLSSTCLVTVGLLVGYIGFGLMISDDSFRYDPYRTVVPGAFYVLVLTPLAALAVTTRSERVASAATLTWAAGALVTLFGGIHALVEGKDGILGLGALHLLGAAILGTFGLWLLPEKPDE